jgi:hypothetical protein
VSENSRSGDSNNLSSCLVDASGAAFGALSTFLLVDAIAVFVIDESAERTIEARVVNLAATVAVPIVAGLLRSVLSTDALTLADVIMRGCAADGGFKIAFDQRYNFTFAFARGIWVAIGTPHCTAIKVYWITNGWRSHNDFRVKLDGGGNGAEEG